MIEFLTRLNILALAILIIATAIGLILLIKFLIEEYMPYAASKRNDRNNRK